MDERWQYPFGGSPASPDDAYALFKGMPGFDEPDLGRYLQQQDQVDDIGNAFPLPVAGDGQGLNQGPRIMDYRPDRDGPTRFGYLSSADGSTDTPPSSLQPMPGVPGVIGTPGAGAPSATADPWTMDPSQKGIDDIKRYERGAEGPSLPPYPDAGHESQGYGHRLPDGTPHPDITQPQAEAWLRDDVAKAAAAVKSLVNVPLTQAQFDALTSLVYNVGPAGFAKSRALQNLNQGDYLGAGTEMLTFDHANGKINGGLTNRDRDQANHFMGSDSFLLPQTRPDDTWKSYSFPPLDLSY